MHQQFKNIEHKSDVLSMREVNYTCANLNKHQAIKLLGIKSSELSESLSIIPSIISKEDE